jgi:hypothetical protein
MSDNRGRTVVKSLLFFGVQWTARHVASRTRAKAGIAGTAERLWLSLAPGAVRLFRYRIDFVANVAGGASLAYRRDSALKETA